MAATGDFLGAGSNPKNCNGGEELGIVVLAHANLTCHHCKQKGHIKPNCPLLKGKKGKGSGQNKRKGKTKCNNCGKNGHDAKDCWEKLENASKCPEWYNKFKNKQNETGAAALDGTSDKKVEFMMMVVDSLVMCLSCDKGYGTPVLCKRR